MVWYILGMSIHRKRTNKRILLFSNEKLTLITNRFRRHKLFTIALLILIFSLLFFISTPRSYSNESVIPLRATQQKTSNLELGDTQVIQKGIDGAKTVNYETDASLFNLVFRPSTIKKYKIVETTIRKSEDSVTNVGTRRYQYMICSTGAIRYYTDEKFKDENIGFTSKSEDSCAQNNTGVRVKLADTPSGEVSSQPVDRMIPYVDSSCHKEVIIKYSIVREDRSYLPKDTRQIGTPGRDGFTLVCPTLKSANSRTIFSVQNEIVYIGTGKTSQQIVQEKADAEQLKQEQNLRLMKNERAFQQSQCYSSLRAQGVQELEAKIFCQQQYPLL